MLLPRHGLAVVALAAAPVLLIGVVAAAPRPRPAYAQTGFSDTPTATISPTSAPLRSRVEVLTLPSHDWGRTSRTVRVYRPAVVDSPLLPVLYLLHGQYGSPTDPFNAGMQAALDSLFRSGVPPFAVAVPDGTSASRSDDEWGDAADRADLLETFLAKQVLPAVEGRYPRDRAHRAVAGFSMGGYAAAYTAGLQVASYGQVVSLAGYFHPDDPEGVFPSSSQLWAHYPLGRAAALSRTRVLLLDCNREYDPVIRGEMGRMQAALVRAGHPAGVRVSAGDHGWSWVQGQWPLVARFLGQGWGQVR